MLFTKAYNDTPRGSNNWNLNPAWYQESAAIWFVLAGEETTADDWQQCMTNSARRAATARYIMGIRESDYDHG